eukprot:319770-Chlamydomonas_euryale.AAC.1
MRAQRNAPSSARARLRAAHTLKPRTLTLDYKAESLQPYAIPSRQCGHAAASSLYALRKVPAPCRRPTRPMPHPRPLPMYLMHLMHPTQRLCPLPMHH